MAIQPVYQAGQLKPTDTVIKHTFFIKSTGTAALLIDSIGGSCDCVGMTWEKKPINPGDSGFVNVTVRSDTSDKKGNKMQQVVVKTNSSTPFTIFKVYFTR